MGGNIQTVAVTLLLGVAALGGSSPLFAKPTYTGLFGNTAAGGYNVVSYFVGNGTPQRGDTSFSVTHNGAVYLFATKGKADTFKASPAKYAPQSGDYRAWALAGGSKAAGDPNYYRLVGGNLYLNYNKDFKEK